MKFTVDQQSLTYGVNWVSRSLSSRPIKTELLGIKIDATGDEVLLSGSDLETSSKSSFKADILEKGAVLVPGKLLAEISRSLPNKPITITLDGSRVLVTSGSAKFTLPTLSLSLNTQTFQSFPKQPVQLLATPLQQLLHRLQSRPAVMIHYQHLPVFMLKSTKRQSHSLPQIATV